MPRMKFFPEMTTRHARLATAATTASLIIIAFFTLGPGDPGEPLVPVTCVRCGSVWLTDLTANVVLFIPFGVAATLSRLRPWRVMLIGFAVSLGVETWQFLGVAGRDATLADVLANTLGSLLGALGAPSLRASVNPEPARAHALVVASGLLIVATAVSVSPLLGPTRPAAPLYLQIEPDNEGPRPAPTRVSAVTLNGTRVVGVGRLPRSLDVRGALQRKRFILETRIHDAPVGRGLTVLVRVTPPLVAAVAEVGVSPDEWYGGTGLRGEDFGLRGLRMSVPRERNGSDSVLLSVERTGPLLQLRARTPKGGSSRMLELSVLDLWVPFMPFRTTVGERPLPMSVALAFVVPAILGWWAGLARNHVDFGIVIGALGVAATCPILTAGLAAPPAWAWILAITSILAGWHAGRQRRQRD